MNYFKRLPYEMTLHLSMHMPCRAIYVCVLSLAIQPGLQLNYLNSAIILQASAPLRYFKRVVLSTCVQRSTHFYSSFKINKNVDTIRISRGINIIYEYLFEFDESK